jgi:hypothetical protein
MLKRISEIAVEHGLDFTLGVWMQMPVPRYPGAVLVEDLPDGEKAADYCARGLKLVLETCPAIGRVQLRMNAEAGVEEDRQLDFFAPIFRAMRDCGRKIKLELRYKGLRPETTKAARELGLDVTVSTKFWCEHLGLPYHPTESSPTYRVSRFGIGAMLHHPRDYRVMYQLWTVGSQRLLVWGDPEYASRFARACRLGDGEGFEVFAPLTNKGLGNAPGNWRIFADRSYEESDREQDRYWLFYLVFGRMGYNPDCKPVVWQREFRHRFGPAAADVESAYRTASQILALVTVVAQFRASEFGFWPEMETAGPLTKYVRIPPSDTAQFYGVRSFKQSPEWHGDPGWDPAVPGYVEDALKGTVRARWSPARVSGKLRTLADSTLASLKRAREKVPDPKSAVFRATELDLSVLANLGLFHADKRLAATHLAFFEETDETGRLPVALKHMRVAADAWERIVRLTDGVYRDKLVFGKVPTHMGHWKDQLPEVRGDVAFLEGLLKKHGGEGKQFRVYPGEDVATDRPRIAHEPIRSATPGKDFTLSLEILRAPAPERVLLHYRPVDQTADWKQITMRPIGDGRYQGTIPGKDITARFDLSYYFEALSEGGGGTLWPSWEEGPPYVVVDVKR